MNKKQRQQKKIPYSYQSIGNEEKMAVLQVLNSDWLTQGPTVEEFERLLAKQVGAKFAVAVSSGTAALHLASLALALKPNDEVITSPISFLATSNAILYAQAKPVFCDIEPESQNINPIEIEKKITKKTKAIYLTHFAGYAAELKQIKEIAVKHKLYVVEDAAHALGATYQGDAIGSCKYSDMTVFSFHPVKHITTGEGGAITTNDKKLYDQLRLYRTHGVTKEKKLLKDKAHGSWYYEMHCLGFNYRMSDIQAALGIAQIKKLAKFISARRKIAENYNQGLGNISELRLPFEAKRNKHAYHLYIVRLNTKKFISKRQEIFEALHKAGIGVQVHYIPITMQPYYKELGYSVKDCPQALSYYKSAISIPIYPLLSKTNQQYVLQVIKAIIEQFK